MQKILREQGTEHVKKLVGEQVAKGSAGKVSPASAAEAPKLLTALEVRALRGVMAELTACRDLLALPGDERGAQRGKRATSRG